MWVPFECEGMGNPKFLQSEWEEEEEEEKEEEGLVSLRN